MNNLITVLWIIGSSFVLIIASYLICCLIGFLNRKIEASNEQRRENRARTKIVNGIIKTPAYNKFFKASYYEIQEIKEYTHYPEEEEEQEEESEDQMTPEEMEEFCEVYERRGNSYNIGTFGKIKNKIGLRKNPEHEYSMNYPTTTYTQTDDLTDYTTRETENVTMTISECCNGEVYEYDMDEVEVSSDAMMKKILQKIRDNHDSELIKGRI